MIEAKAKEGMEEDIPRYQSFEHIQLVTVAMRRQLLIELGEAERGGGVRRTEIASSRENVLHLKKEVEIAMLELLNPQDDSRRKFVLQWMVEEFILNGGTKHGNSGNPEMILTVSHGLDDARNRGILYVADRGPGFNIHELPNPAHPDYLERPHGRGICTADKLHFGSVGAKGHYLPMEEDENLTREILITIPHSLT